MEKELLDLFTKEATKSILTNNSAPFIDLTGLIWIPIVILLLIPLFMYLKYRLTIRATRLGTLQALEQFEENKNKPKE